MPRRPSTRPSTHPTALIRTLALALFAAAALALALPTAPTAHAQTGTVWFFPEVHTDNIRYGLVANGGSSENDGGDLSLGLDALVRRHMLGLGGLAPRHAFAPHSPYSPLSPHSPLAPLGQEGYGKTVIEVMNDTGGDVTTSLRVFAKFDGSAAGRTGGTIGAGRVAAYDLSVLSNQAGSSSFGGELTTTDYVAALARTRWPSGAGVAIESAPGARALLLPLMAVNVGSQSSVLILQNAAPGSGTQADIKINDPKTGAPLVAFPEPLDDHQIAEWDTSVEANLFGPETLAPNAAGGFIGPLRITGPRSLALIGYVDDHANPGTAGLVARPIDTAATVQVLPRVRGGADGGTLIAVANATDKAVQATVRFFAENGGSAGVPAERKLTIAGLGAAYIDLSPGGRSIPADAGAPAPFRGSAVVTASGAILAAALEDWRVGGKVDALAGYNAFGPKDLSTRFSVPVIRRATDFVSTDLVLHNPGAAPANARLRAYDSTGQGRVDSVIPLAPGASHVVEIATLSDFPIGTGRASVESDTPLGVLVYERRDASRTYPPKPLTFPLEDERNSMVKGQAVLTPDGTTLHVNITITEGSTSASMIAHIQATTCSDEDAAALHPLSEVIGGRSSTTLTDIDFRALADGKHAIRLLRGTGRFGGRVSCGIIPQVRGVEVADASAVGALALDPGPDALPTAGPTAPTAPPAATTAVPSPTATRGIATPTFIAQEPVGTIYLPVSRRNEP